MDNSRFKIFLAFCCVILIIWAILLIQVVVSARTIHVAPPTQVVALNVHTATPTPTYTPVVFPPTWTPTWTPTPRPTWTPVPPTPTPTPTRVFYPTPVPLANMPIFHRPTPVFVDILPSTNPSSSYTVPTAVPLMTMPDNAITILLLGSDRRPNWKGWNTDVIQYLVVYPEVPAVNLLSIPRDLYVYIPDVGMNRINTANTYGVANNYDGGGLGLLNQTLLYNLGISADYYVMVDFDGLIGIVNALEGVDVPVYCRIEDYWPYANEAGEYPRFVLEPGMHHLDGEQALWFSRTRKTTSVFSRERRQQQVLEAIWRKARQQDLIAVAPELYEKTQSLYQTDLSWTDLLSLVQIAAQLEPADLHRYNIGRQQVIPYTTYQGGNVVLPVWEQIEPVLNAVLTTPSSSRALQDAIPVEVWNGAGYTDWDKLAAEQLLHSGYWPTVNPPDHTGYTSTYIVYFNEVTKGSGLERLQALFNVAPENVILMPEPYAPFKARVIIGQDYQPCMQP